VQAPGEGVVHRFQSGGAEVDQLTLPIGWKAATATDAELKAFGFPARPTNASDLARWNQTWGQITRSFDPGICLYQNESAGAPAYPYPSVIETSQNWSGYEDGASPNKTQVAGTWYQTGFSSRCQAGATYASWVGIGGDTAYFPTITSHLIQDGSLANSGWNGPITMFWEAIDYVTGFDSQPAGFSGAKNINPGDGMGAVVVYNPTAVTLQFVVADFAPNGGLGNVTMHNVPGYFNHSGSLTTETANHFIDATSQLSEWVDERISVNGSPTPILAPYLGNTFWTDATSTNSVGATWRPAQTPGYLQIQMKQHHGSVGSGNQIMNVPGYILSGTNGSWYDYWQNLCS
jgi:hypothetical protein